MYIAKCPLLFQQCVRIPAPSCLLKCQALSFSLIIVCLVAENDISTVLIFLLISSNVYCFSPPLQ